MYLNVYVYFIQHFRGMQLVRERRMSGIHDIDPERFPAVELDVISIENNTVNGDD